MNTKLVELLQQMLETELGGVKIYQTALDALATQISGKNGPNIFSKLRTTWKS